MRGARWPARETSARTRKEGGELRRYKESREQQSAERRQRVWVWVWVKDDNKTNFRIRINDDKSNIE